MKSKLIVTSTSSSWLSVDLNRGYILGQGNMRCCYCDEQCLGTESRYVLMVKRFALSLQNVRWICFMCLLHLASVSRELWRFTSRVVAVTNDDLDPTLQ